MPDPSLRPIVINENERPRDGWDDPVRGRIHWRTLFSKGLSASEAITCGVASLEPGDWLARHRHAPPEIYYVLDGTGIVTLEEKEVAIEAGHAVFIPAMARHGIRQTGERTLKFFYAFAVDGFEDVTYLFPGDEASV